MSDGDAVVERDGEMESVRAEAGEGRAGALIAKVSELEEALREARGSLERSERGRALDLALLEAETIDLESTRLLAERAMESEGLEARDAAAEVRRRKPYLFRVRDREALSATMSVRADGDAGAPLRRAASEAASSGDRVALLRYLRLRRG